MLCLQDDVLEKSRHTIEREYEKLCRAARERAAAHPGEVASVTTEDAWTWVEEQAGTTFTGEDINMVLQVPSYLCQPPFWPSSVSQDVRIKIRFLLSELC